MSTTELSNLEGAVTTTAPSGALIAFQSRPKRKYTVDGEEVPSVSEILNILDKPGLPWWGMQVGVEGANELVKRGKLAYAQSTNGELIPVVVKDDVWAPATTQDIIDLLTAEKITVNHVKDKAAKRGGNVHDALEMYGMTKMLPVVENFPEEERGYVQSLRSFLDLVQGNMHTKGLEVMVASKEHRFAGRYDLDVVFDVSFPVVRKVFPKKNPVFVDVEPGPWLIDLKTSKGVYETHLFQLEAYEIARVECGHEPTVGRAVLHVQADGRYEFVPSPLGPDGFLKLRAAYDAIQEAKAALK